MSMQEFKGKVKKVFFCQDNNSWASFRLHTKDDDYTVSGNVPGTILKGQIVTIIGEMSVHPQYGKQIRIKEIKFDRNSTEAVYSQLTSGCFSGIGKTTATLIYDKFGNKALDVLRDTPDEFLKIKGIGKKKLKAITDSYEKNYACLDLISFVNGNITKLQAEKLLKHYGNKTFSVLKKNPYILIRDLRGYGFAKADALALGMGIKEDSIFRISAAIHHVLTDAADHGGHCYLLSDDIAVKTVNMLVEDIYAVFKGKKDLEALKKLVGMCNSTDLSEMIRKSCTHSYSDNTIACISEWLKKREYYFSLCAKAMAYGIKEEFYTLEEDRLYLTDLYQAEVKCADIISYCASNRKKIMIPNLQARLSELGQKYGRNNDQIEAVSRALTNNISVITGGPGCGKTTIIQDILSLWGDRPSVLCAPTGRAAKRMSESTGHPAYTIHRMLLQQKKNGGILRDCLVVIDESSMIDIELAARMLPIMKESVIVIVGDIDQLESVRPGAFLKDIINSKTVPVTYLTKTYRNSGSIIANAKAFNKGHGPKSFLLDENFHYYPVPKEERYYTNSNIINTYMKLRALTDQNGYAKYMPSDICILTPMVRGVKELNEKLRELCNPSSDKNKIPQTSLRIGDRVMQTANNYSLLIMRGKYKSFGVFNGDCGTITGSVMKENDFYITVKMDDGAVAFYSKNDANALVFAWAMTYHKAQGSEYKIILMNCDYSHYTMLKRNLIYTGITRAKEAVYFWGETEAVNKAAETDPSEKNTSLQKRISEKKISTGA